MKLLNTILVAVSLVVACLVISPTDASAQVPRFTQDVLVGVVPTRAQSPSETVLTFSTPVALPGVSLGAGTYVFQFIGGVGRVIQVLGADRAMVYGTILPMTIDRTDARMNQMWIGEPLAGDSPRTIQGWFRAGEAIGYGFVFPGRRPIEQVALVLDVPTVAE
jgi:hypothetical protein